MTLHFYNTEKRQKELFKAFQDHNVKMYTCGPTVYDYAHIGNFRTYVFEDILRRTLKFFGFKVTQVMNLTDVDDKTIKGAINKNITLDTFTEPFKKAFFDDLKALNIESAEYYPAATDYIPQMIQFIEKLLEKKHAYYSKDKSIYYSIASYPSYGKLSHLHLKELKVGAGEARVTSDEYDKENVSDFVLWKAYDPTRDGKIFWESPFGKGRPGWHLECSTMAMHILGETIDIHVGGVDNIFPHHENEIAQSEAYSGKPFVKFWMHSEHLLVNHKKMSKSLGNFFTLRDLLQKGFTGMEVRYLLLSSHYRVQLNFTFEGLEAARNSLSRIKDFIFRLNEIAKEEPPTNIAIEIVHKINDQFSKALADDLNTSVALSALFDFIYEVNVLCDQKKVPPGDAHHYLHLLKKFNSVLGVLQFDLEESIPEEVQMLLEKREFARKNKFWSEADKYRHEITSKGYIIEDTPKGARLKKK